MSACPPITLEGITAGKYATLIQTAQAQGLQLTGDAGITQYQGMDFTWNYDPAAAALTIQCTSKPIFVPCSMIESRIRSLVG
jgi:hypothetical protein